MSLWKPYTRSDDLVNLLIELSSDNEKDITINMRDGGLYNCTIVNSENFKGMSYYKGVNSETNEVKHIAIGDDNIILWLDLNYNNELA